LNGLLAMTAHAYYIVSLPDLHNIAVISGDPGISSMSVRCFAEGKPWDRILVTYKTRLPARSRRLQRVC